MTATDETTTLSDAREDGSVVSLVFKIGRWFGLLLLVGVIGVPLWASVSYRLAVGDLHEELADIQPASAELIDSYVSSCYNDVAPASVRVFEPTGDAELLDLQSAYLEVLRSRGFESGSVGGDVAWGRERDDALDSDLVQFHQDEAANTLTVIADAYDIDMVACIPLTGRR